MGCLPSKQLDVNDPLYQAKQADRAITEAINKNNRQKQLKKVLILGAGESGKSTVIKQLRILNNREFTKEERMRYAQVIWADAVTCMCVLITEARKKRIPLDSDNNDSVLKPHKEAITSYKKNILENIDTDTAGGEKFINDYLAKYAGASQKKRQMSSTGKVETFDDGYDYETDTLMPEKDVRSSDEDSTLNYAETRTTSVSNLSSGVTGFISKNRAQRPVTRYEVALAINELWTKDLGIKEIWERRSEFQIEVNADYYFDNVMKFVDENYLASDNDILKARIKTTGIQETIFNIQGQDFKFLDAGGQRSERKKWLKSFENITAVLFVLAISEYDQVLFEDNQVNRIVESMMLYKTLVNSRWFYNTPFILFLNKTDLFEEKVKRTPLSRYLLDYKGRVGDYEDGIKYFTETFHRYNKSKKPVYIRPTRATDTKSMKFVMAAVIDAIMRENLKATGMM